MTKSRRATKIIARIALCLLGIALIFVVAVVIAEAVADRSAHTLPSYEKVDISETLEKALWTEEDYDLLYRQTGLGRTALDKLKKFPDEIKEFQDALFREVEIEHDKVIFFTSHDMMTGFRAPLAPLEEGDILLTSSGHTLGWRHGHAALVIDSRRGYERVIEAAAMGTNSRIGNAGWFCGVANFVVLRLKDKTRAERQEIADWAYERLNDIPYNLFTGIFSAKDQGENVKGTHCSHLVWQAYKHFGYEIDANGGLICTPRDIARSDLFEVVQVFGFDPIKLW